MSSNFEPSIIPRPAITRETKKDREHAPRRDDHKFRKLKMPLQDQADWSGPRPGRRRSPGSTQK
ncbi:MAG: hypothetical protein COB53_13075 [Elusimicrobia bacterium]|nr:MAG: hypothetical protein COB53_13075 [Elusimicrobiota bacterium]